MSHTLANALETLKSTHPNSLEVEIASWLVCNSEALTKNLKESFPFPSLPPTFDNLYITYYNTVALDYIKAAVCEAFALNPENVLSIVNEQFITNLLGTDFLKPKKEAT